MKTVTLLNANEALSQMDQLINQKPQYRTWIGNEIKEFYTLKEWFQSCAAHELNIDTSKAYIDIKDTKYSILVILKDKYNNKPIKKLYFNKDITKYFTLANDGLYYSKAWSKNDNTIEIDGLGWTIEQVKEYILQYEAIPTIKENTEILKDDIRSYFIK